MGILYAISILAFAALLWAALSVARHVRLSQPVDEAPLPPARKPSTGERPFLEPESTVAPSAPAPARPFEFFDPREFKLHPTQNQVQTPVQTRPFISPVTPPTVTPAVAGELQTHDLPIHGVRRPPRKPAPPRVSDRLDWAYFNKDLGDLNDPEPANRATPNRSNIKQA
jgi:hypothetical protein